MNLELFGKWIFCAVLFLFCPPVGIIGAMIVFVQEKDRQKQRKHILSLSCRQQKTDSRAA